MRNKAEERLAEPKDEDERKTRAKGSVREEEKKFNHKSQREPPNVAVQGDLKRRGLAGGHTLQLVVMGTPKAGSISILVRVGSKQKDGKLEKGLDFWGLQKAKAQTL